MPGAMARELSVCVCGSQVGSSLVDDDGDGSGRPPYICVSLFGARSSCASRKRKKKEVKSRRARVADRDVL